MLDKNHMEKNVQEAYRHSKKKYIYEEQELGQDMYYEQLVNIIVHSSLKKRIPI